MIQILSVLLVSGLTLGILAGLLVVSSLLRGFVLYKLWGWFMVPALGVPTIGIAAAIGIATIASFLTAGPFTYAEEQDPKQKKIKAVNGILFPFMVLLVGYIAHLYL